MTTTAPRHDDDLTAAEYVLGVLPAAERAAFAARLPRETQLRDAVWRWEMRLSGLADEIAEVPPPAAARDAIFATLFGETKRARLWNSLALWRTASAGLLAAAVLGFLYLRTPAPVAPVYVAELTAKDASVRVIALYDSGTGTLHVDRRAGSVAAGRTMQLWLIAGNAPPKPLGLMPETGSGAVVIPAELRASVSTAVLAMSDEPAGGSPTGLPTGPVLATGTVHSL